LFGTLSDLRRLVASRNFTEMSKVESNKFGRAVALMFLFCMAPTFTVFAQDVSRHTIPNSTMGFVSTAQDLGPEEASKQITLTLWLRLQNAASLRELVEQQYDPSSANFHNWLTAEQFNAAFAPTVEEVATVKEFLAAHDLRLSSVGERNMYVRARGSIAEVQLAFRVQIDKFRLRGKIYHANLSAPIMEGPAGALVTRVGGLSDYGMQPDVRRVVNPRTGQPRSPIPVSSGLKAPFSSVCLQSPQVVNFSTDGSSPTATYFGYMYGTDVVQTGDSELMGCGYQPGDIQTGYNLNGLYRLGLNGAGQTVVIVDAYGSPTLWSDTSYYSSYYGLNPLDLGIYRTCPAPQNEGGTWALETTLDVEAAHTVAPGAKIAVVYACTDSWDDLGAAILLAIDGGLGDTISDSWGAPETDLGGAPFTAFDNILGAAAVQGISVSFSSGDEGDLYSEETQTDVSYPASSPYATGIGGTSLFLTRDKTMAFQTGWGTNLTEIANPLDPSGYSAPLVPPDTSSSGGFGFLWGAGGGTSRVYRKPAFQAGLPGLYRKIPDTSFLADPFTGLELICAGSSCFGLSSSAPYLEVVGGTSLACPMFSALWAIANQQAGRPLGQAARSLYNLPSNALYDVVPLGSSYDVSGTITASGQVTRYSPFQLVAPETPAPFLSTMWEERTPTSYGDWLVISFGTDSSLFTGPGWDDVTGVGTPNGLDFVNAVASPHD